MSAKDFKVILKILSKTGGYPNDNFKFIVNSVGYNTTNFLVDMVDALDFDKSYEFIDKTLESLSEGKKGIRIDLKPYFGTDSWAYLKIKGFWIDFDESEECIMLSASWGDSKIIHPEDGFETTIDEMYADVDMGEFSDWDDFISSIQDEANAQIERKTGFCFWWD
jgi:hypothetical protein